ARSWTELGEYMRGQRYARYAYRVLRNGDDHRSVGEVGVALGLCCTRLGRNAEALEWFQDAAATFRRIDDADGLVIALNNLGIVYKNLREWREATRFFEQALEIRLGIAYLMLGRPEPAQIHLARGAAVVERLGDPIEQAIAERAFARLDAMRGNVAGMETKLRVAAHRFEQLTENYELALTLAAWGEILFALPAGTRAHVDLDPVAEATKRAAALFRGLGVPSLAAEAYLVLARLTAERERF